MYTTKHQTSEFSEESIPAERWPRFSRYEVVDGIIRPHAKATIEWYDPAQEDASRPDGERPYQELMRVVQRLQIRQPHGGAPYEIAGRRAAEDLLQWCRRFGLLGILPHQWVGASFAPRWYPAAEWLSETVDKTLDPKSVFGSRLVAVQHQVWRIAGGWSVNLRIPDRFTDDSSLEGEVATAGDDETANEFQPPHALLRDLNTDKVTRISLDDPHWYSFFPAITLAPTARDFFYSWPRREPFWRGYGEPLWSFVHTVNIMVRTVAAMEAKAGLQNLQAALAEVNQLASVVSPVAALGREDYPHPRMQWSSPSLIGLLAFHLLNDLAGRHTIRRCEECGGYFVKRRDDRRTRLYCSPRCRSTAQQRRHRKGGSTPPTAPTKTNSKEEA